MDSLPLIYSSPIIRGYFGRCLKRGSGLDDDRFPVLKRLRDLLGDRNGPIGVQIPDRLAGYGSHSRTGDKLVGRLLKQASRMPVDAPGNRNWRWRYAMSLKNSQRFNR